MPRNPSANDKDHEASDDAATERRRSTRSRAPPEWYGNPVLTVLLVEDSEPTNYEEAMMSPDAEKWLEAMKYELGSMSENQVWTLVEPPSDRKAVECNGFLRRKQTRMVMLLSIKHGLSRKVFDKFKVLTTMRLSLP